MTIRYITFLCFSFFLCAIFSSCNDDDHTISYSTQTNDAQIYSFAIKAGYPKRNDEAERSEDTIRLEQVNKTKFAINQVTGTIYNPDSMPYGTILNKVKITAKYNPVYGASGVKVFTPDSLNGYIWNNTDSINFTKSPVSLVVTSHGGKTKNYDIDIRIHQVDPDTLSWQKMSSYPQALGKSKTLLVNNETFYTYSVTVSEVALFSTNRKNISWKKQTISGLPTSVDPESIFMMSGIFFAIDNAGKSYTSSDGKSWNVANNGENVIAILGVIPMSGGAQLLLLVDDASVKRFAITKDLSALTIVKSINGEANIIPSLFPVKNVASYSNDVTNTRQQMLVLTGGVDGSGREISQTWLVKASGKNLEIASFANNAIFKGSGLSTFRYDDLLYAFASNKLYLSKDWGGTWLIAPSKQAVIPAIEQRKGQTIIVDSENYIWLFGGLSTQNTYLNDVWRGQLNRLSL